MKKTEWLARLLCAVLIFISIASASDTANVGGTWTVTASQGAGSATQTLVIQQDGAKITGTFKGPRQSGTLAGTVSGNTVTIHVDARVPLDYTGTADGDNMKGTLSGGGKTADWTATRSK